MSALNADAAHGASHYLRTKGEAEQLVRAASLALEWTIFRPSVIFGRADSLTNRFAQLLRLGARMAAVGACADALRADVGGRCRAGVHHGPAR